MVICSRCIIDDSIPGVVFDDRGVCNYCKLHDEMDVLYPVDKKLFYDLVSDIKKEGKGKDFDAVIGVSGGCDSSFLLDFLYGLGLRLLAVHMDNGWNTSIAVGNMHKMTRQLGVPLEIVKVDTRVFDSLCRSFLFASTPDADIPNDLALLEVVNQVALDNDIKYVVNGHSFRTEGSAPLGWTYMDGGYLENVNSCFENVDITGFPYFSWDKQMEFWDHGIKIVRPLYYIPYNKKDVIKYLVNNYRWVWYKGLHAENIYTKFVGNYLWVKKFGIDYRKIEFSALVRSGFKNRDDAIVELESEKTFDLDYFNSICGRLGLSYSDIERIMGLPVKSFRDYKNYLSRFRSKQFRGMFDVLLKENKIPFTFYKKYVLGV